MLYNRTIRAVPSTEAKAPEKSHNNCYQPRSRPHFQMRPLLSEGSHDVISGESIATWRVIKRKPQNSEQGERAATRFRRMGANRPIYKPEYWEMVKELDANSNEEDPSNNCMPAGVPRMGSPSYI